jgi:hypothetical protein
MSESCEVQQSVGPEDKLFVPHRKRLKHYYVTSSDGRSELHIDYGRKEITFDDERFFSFGERLVAETCFVAQSATQWGAGYTWEELSPMLEALVSEGILKRGDLAAESREGGLVASLLPPSTCPSPRFWNALECEGITRDLGKRTAEIGLLETFVPIYRVAHAAIDGDDRQVGEANVYPRALRLDRPTEWRVCQYAGSRYRDETPMNVTALKAMIKHWKPMMVSMLRIREEVGRRLGLKEGAAWSVGDLHTLACAVLALPAYVLQRGGGSSPQPPLHPVLSSLFRITDGIRMTTYEMFFFLKEKPKRADDPLTGAQIYDYAEHHGVFIGDTGVCAGPRPLIDEFLAAAVDGTPIAGADEVELPEEVARSLHQLPAALEYGLLGLQLWGLTLSTWLEMSRAYERLRTALAPIADTLGSTGVRLVAALDRDWEKLERVQISTDYERDVHFVAYKDAYERARRARLAPSGAATLEQAIAPVPGDARHAAASEQIRAALKAKLALPELGGEKLLDELTDALVRYLRVEQAIASAATSLQREINSTLARPQPNRTASARDFLLFYSLNGSVFPYLFDILEDELGLRIESDAMSFEISLRQAS